MFKIGDKVKVIKNNHKIFHPLDGPKEYYNNYIDKVGVILDIDNDYFLEYKIEFHIFDVLYGQKKN